MVNKPLIRPYFWGGTLGGGRLTSHDTKSLTFSPGDQRVAMRDRMGPIEHPSWKMHVSYFIDRMLQWSIILLFSIAILRGGFKYFLFSPLLGEMIQFD